VLGHCQLVPDEVRGPGDPGDGIFRALLDAGFEGVRVEGAVAAPRHEAAAPAGEVPAWVDAAREVRDTHDVAVTPEAWVRASLTTLEALGVSRDRAAEVIAWCAVECSWGTRAIAHNMGGVKLKQRDDAAYRAKHGCGLAWWRAPGHREAGDDAVEWYRGFDDAVQFWAFFLKRYAPRPEGPAERDRYEEAGAVFWGDAPERWVVELLLAGYRGSVREQELEQLLDAGQRPEAHPSIARHRVVVERVKGLLRGA
jgi:hypothetical protein